MTATLVDKAALAARARALGTLNGIDFALVRLDPASPPAWAVLELHCFNDQHLDDLVAAASTPAALWSLAPLSGGERLVAGPLSGQVKVTQLAHAAPQVLAATIAPVGDYSRYTLTLAHPGFDPVFAQFILRFRPGCFSADCSPRVHPPARPDAPVIDYLAKDYDSFRHVLIAGMMQRVPGWQPTSEAAFDVVLLDLFAAAADELSNYQDRVMGEATWASARRRVSLRRHARLMDYFIHEGQQASTLLALDFPGTAGYTVPAGRTAWTGPDATRDSAVWFVTAGPAIVSGLFSRVSLYTWSGAYPGLRKGATQADLAFDSFADATEAASLVDDGSIARLLVQEWLNPATGRPADRDPRKRQVLGLTGAQLLTDPLTGAPLVRVTWRADDALAGDYPFVVEVDGVPVPGVSLFHGNLVDMVQGRPVQATYVPAGVAAPPGVFHVALDASGAAECRLPPAFPVLWTQTAPGGQQPAASTLRVTVADASGSATWLEQADLVHSDGASDRHFVVETDEALRSLVRFGDGVNGLALPDDASVLCEWLCGVGPDGNVGQDVLAHVDATGLPDVALGRCWNPFDVTDGLAPEPADVIRRRVPEAFLARQARAVTLADYAARACEVPGVSNAAAFYRWTGSWRTVRVVVDPQGTTTLAEPLREAVERQLDALHLIGEDVEVRAPEFVPLTIAVVVCVSAGCWIGDVAPVVEEAFTDGRLPDGTPAFFHPDLWTFGQALHASQIEGVLAGIPGVEHVVAIRMTRWWNPAVSSSETMAIAAQEIVRVANDPNRLELGTIAFEFQGGAR